MLSCVVISYLSINLFNTKQFIVATRVIQKLHGGDGV